MSANSKIEWTHHTFNPWWGCARVSPGCEHCYAEAFAKRTGNDVWGPAADRRFFGEKHWDEPRKWNAAAAKVGERHRVFCASMADVFEDRRDLDVERTRLWQLIDETRHLDWLLLTKRPENVDRLMPPRWRGGAANVWLGTTIEDQKRADERIPHLLLHGWPAVRFVSCEPLLGEVKFNPATLGCVGHLAETFGNPLVNWIIIGGESGGGARIFDFAHGRKIVMAAHAEGAAVFVKQAGAIAIDADDSFAPLPLSNRKGSAIEDFPDDMRIREYPQPQAYQRNRSEGW